MELNQAQKGSKEGEGGVTEAEKDGNPRFNAFLPLTSGTMPSRSSRTASRTSSKSSQPSPVAEHRELFLSQQKSRLVAEVSASGRVFSGGLVAFPNSEGLKKQNRAEEGRVPPNVAQYALAKLSEEQEEEEGDEEGEEEEGHERVEGSNELV